MIIAWKYVKSFVAVDIKSMDILQQPLFLNPEIKVQDKISIGQHFIVADISQIKELCFEVIAGSKLLGKPKERSKLIIIADNSTRGGTTVKEYESNDIADNDENEKNIRQAETRALKTIKEKKTRPQSYTARPTPAVEHIATAPAPSPAYDFSRYQQPFRASTAREPCLKDSCNYYASNVACGAYPVELENKIFHKMWNEIERCKNSTWREMRATEQALLSFSTLFMGKSMKSFTDNQNWVRIVQDGSMKEELQNLAYSIFCICKEHNIFIELQWIPRTLNSKADHNSKMRDHEDWQISNEFLIFRKFMGTFYY
ncbi:unnamed protein product [Mytilus coruscus]|uniref:RNase H type-1 domain-containing protein n=1 Tax=Mytilus coruscus TaxID=42192 RepID=A0A6J8CBV5_MYTCO|nr:unnamed protein product [Mytilus coruscus]